MTLTGPLNGMNADAAGEVEDSQWFGGPQNSQYRLGFSQLRLLIMKAPLEVLYVEVWLAITMHRAPGTLH